MTQKPIDELLGNVFWQNGYNAAIRGEKLDPTASPWFIAGFLAGFYSAKLIQQVEEVNHATKSE